MIKLKNLLIVLGILILVLTIFVIVISKNSQTAVLANGTTISNKKHGWGVKRMVEEGHIVGNHSPCSLMDVKKISKITILQKF